MKITGIKISDFLMLEEVELKPNSKKNVFIGKNRQGKTSITKAIEVCINGTSDKDVIRTGADESKIFLEIDHGAMTVDRTIRRDSANKLTVKGTITLPGGKEVFRTLPSPQEYLANIVSKHSFDPIEFVLTEGAERVKYFQRHFPCKLDPETLKEKIDEETYKQLDFSQDAMDILSDVDKILYPQRTKINKDIKQAQAVFQAGVTALGEFDPKTYTDRTEQTSALVRQTETNITEARTIMAQTKIAQEHIQKSKDKIVDFQIKLDAIDNTLIDAIPDLISNEEKLKAQVAELQQILTGVQVKLGEARALKESKDGIKLNIRDQNEIINSYPVNDDPDIEQLESELSQVQSAHALAEEEKDAYGKFQELSLVKQGYETQQVEANKITAILDYIKKELPAKLASEASYPIEGLTIQDNKIFVNGVSLDNCSTSEGVTIGLQIVRAITPSNGLQTICLDRAESLDDESLEAFDKQIAEDEFQYWMTIVEHAGAKVPEGAYRVDGGSVSQYVTKPNKEKEK